LKKYLGEKVNFGFTAQISPGDTIPKGNTNFVISGSDFHFQTKSEPGGGSFKYEELVIDCCPGPEVHRARYWGFGSVARTDAKVPKASDWEDGYRFYVAVQDFDYCNIPTSVVKDTWRIRIFDLDGVTVLFDSYYYTGDAIFVGNPATDPGSDPALCPGTQCVTPDYDGDTVFGGNLDVHCKCPKDLLEARIQAPELSLVDQDTPIVAKKTKKKGRKGKKRKGKKKTAPKKKTGTKKKAARKQKGKKKEKTPAK